jgi:outer membrane immunogenic protein
MIKHALTVAATVAAMTTGVRAADLAVRKAPPLVSSTIFSWTGFYGGFSLGYKFDGQDDVHTEGQAAPNIANIAGGARPGFVALNRNGFIGGIQAGYNYEVGQYGQFGPLSRLVLGIETDISYTDFRDSTTVTTAQLGTGAPLSNTFSSRLNYLGTVRGRLGIANDRALFYATGGLAYGESEHHINMFGATGNLQFAGDSSKVKTGYAVGAGVEYALTYNVMLKGEYLFYDLGKDTVNVAVLPGSGGAGTGYNSRYDDNGHIIRVGMNYKFN